MLQNLVHYALHLLVPGGIAYLYDPEQWKRSWLILLATMLVDLDHLLATPIFEAGRCSIGFHPLHTSYAIAVYILGIVLIKHTTIRLIFIGLLFHMFTDLVDCIWMLHSCEGCSYPGFSQWI